MSRGYGPIRTIWMAFDAVFNNSRTARTRVLEDLVSNGRICIFTASRGLTCSDNKSWCLPTKWRDERTMFVGHRQSYTKWSEVLDVSHKPHSKVRKL